MSQLPKTPGELIVPDQILPPNLFVLPMNGPIPFPTLMAPISIQIPRFISTVEEALNRQRMIGIILTEESVEVTEKVEFKQLYSVGVACKILKRIKMPDGSINILVHSMKRFRAKRALSESPYLIVEAEYLNDIAEKSDEMDALSRAVISRVKKLAEVNPFFTDEMRVAMMNAPGPGVVADLVAFALALSKKDTQEFIATESVKARFEKLLVHLNREQGLADIQKRINDEVNTNITQLQREFFLKEQLKTIKKELGVEEDGKDKSARSFRERIEAAGMPEDAKKVATDELEKFETLNENSPEFNISRNYLETLCSLPWSKTTVDNLDLGHAKKTLNDGHYGIEKVKERIVEFLAVRKLKAEQKGSILCLVGPPGVGKTSIGKSIAQTLGRNFFRFSLGGMRDEAEIKGHRRTYIGAMPGKIIQGIKRAGTKNAVLLLDEVDKIGQSFQGDPASALLEVLDPEQNQAFLDHYVDVPFDLSKVLFIATANTTATIPSALLDRMEVIELPGYTLEEKEDIARRFVIPREIAAAGIKPSQLKFDKAALHSLMTDYSREPGLRSLQQLVARICRKAATEIVEFEEQKARSRVRLKPKSFPILVKREELTNWLGPKRFTNELVERVDSPGVVTGLAWTSLGGSILFIEVSDIPGSGGLKLTGQMGDVMSESANIAWSYVKRRVSRELNLRPEFFKDKDFHLHIPAGAIPKDGPSAGVTMATALYSLLTGRVAKARVAMTGELSLQGKVLPVGGIKEKFLAAKRAGVDTIILPKDNEKDFQEVPENAKAGMTVHFVSTIDEVFSLALRAKNQVLAAKQVSPVAANRGSSTSSTSVVLAAKPRSTERKTKKRLKKKK